MSLSVTVDTGKFVEQFGQITPAKLRRLLIRATYRSGMEVQRVARRKIMDPPKSGIVYERGNVRHRASAPGESPANDTGNLARQIQVVKAETVVNDQAVCQIVSSAKYAAALEFGTRDERIKARPYMIPALKESIKPVLDIFTVEIAEALKT